MTPQYKHLLINMPVRHSLTMMDMDDLELSQQIKSSKNMGMTNFFILAR